MDFDTPEAILAAIGATVSVASVVDLTDVMVFEVDDTSKPVFRAANEAITFAVGEDEFNLGVTAEIVVFDMCADAEVGVSRDIARGITEQGRGGGCEVLEAPTGFLKIR